MTYNPPKITLWNRAAIAAARVHNLPLYHVSSKWNFDEWELDLEDALEKVEVAEEDCDCGYDAAPHSCTCGYLSIVFCEVSTHLAPDFEHLD